MDLLHGTIKTLFFRYFRATIASSMVMTIYTVVDTICIGRYEGANGTAAIACVFPLYSILFACGLLFGVGGAVLMAQKRGSGDKAEGDKYFTVGLVASIVVALLALFLYMGFPSSVLQLCGASGEILLLALRYIFWISLFSPLFLLGQYLILFIRNDGAPMHTTWAAIAGGAFNIFGDFYFVFGLDMGIAGAGLATAIGQAISFVVLLAYFFQKRCTIRISFRRLAFWGKLRNILTMGASNFVVDIAMGVLVILFNRQIMTYLGVGALGLYGVVSNLSTTVQTFGYAVGESAQAILSVNFGAGLFPRIRKTLHYAGLTALAIGTLCCGIGLLFPIPLVKFYMTTTPEILAMAPGILRCYFPAFLLLVFNVFSTYYFQAVGRPITALLISLLRGMLLSGLFLLLLPLVFGGQSLWFAVPLAEALVFLFVLLCMRRPLAPGPQQA